MGGGQMERLGVWRRQLLAWEEEILRECQTLLLTVTVQVGLPNRWQWRPDPVSGYSVRDAYQILTSQDTVTIGTADYLLWHNQVPLKVSIFAWRLDNRNFYGILGSIFSSKMTKTSPNTKKNLQNPRKASRRSQECKKTGKSQKYEDLCCSSCHDGSCLLAKKTTEENLIIVLPCSSSWYDDLTWRPS
ncbi:hypothetical protein QL285_082389 [Trifolium repens]|nr:hypothetical protein QL285_082389 [Trifolium repens]